MAIGRLNSDVLLPRPKVVVVQGFNLDSGRAWMGQLCDKVRGENSTQALKIAKPDLQ